MSDLGESIQREWVSTGQQVYVEPGLVDRIKPFDPRSAEHLWVVTTMYEVNPRGMSDPTATPILDKENLVSILGPFCYHCEEPFSERLSHRRCPGVGKITEVRKR